jgi:hypothetical protein
MGGSLPGSKTNYALIAKTKETPKKPDISRLSEIKEAIVKIIYEDFLYWEEKEVKQLGLEKNNLLKKVCSLEKTTTSQIFEYLLEELETEQKIIKFNESGMTRFVWFSLKIEK